MLGDSLKVSVIVPVYNSHQTLEALVSRISQSLASFDAFEIILVDDCSPDTSWDVIQRLSSRFDYVRGIRLGINAGQHSALLAGVRAAIYPISVTIDDDHQNPPEEIPKLIDYLSQNDLDVVYGIPETTRQASSRRLAGKTFRAFLGKVLGAPAAAQITSFRAFKSANRTAFETDLGANVSLDALLAWSTSNFGNVIVTHDARTNGRSNYNLKRLLKFAIDSVTGYSAIPLQLASILGIATSLFGGCILLYVVITSLVAGETVQGFPFLAAIIAIFSGVQLLTLGILGEYLARMHFRVMRKPTYFIAQTTDQDEYNSPH